MYNLAKRLNDDGFKPKTVESSIAQKMMLDKTFNSSLQFIFEWLSDVDEFLCDTYGLLIDLDSTRASDSYSTLVYRASVFSFVDDNFNNIKTFEGKNRKGSLLEALDWLSDNFEEVITAINDDDYEGVFDI